MQLISVERWTFWAAVVLALVGPIAHGWIGSTYTSGSTTIVTDGLFATPLFIVLLVSVALGGSRDPAVRRVAAPPPT